MPIEISYFAQLRLAPYFGDPTFVPATIAPVMMSPATKSEGDDWVFDSG